MLAALALLGAPRLAWGGERYCDPQDSQSCIQVVPEGAPAPFSGHLLTPRRAAVVTEALEKCRLWTALDRAEAGELCLAQQTVWMMLRESDLQAHVRAEAALMQRIVELEAKAPHWTERPWFVIASTVLGTTLVVWTVFQLAPGN